MSGSFRETEAARALVNVIGECRWKAVALAPGYLVLEAGGDAEEAARAVYEGEGATLRRSREFVEGMSSGGFLQFLEPRKRTGSAENPITKLFPGTVTEERFQELLDDLLDRRAGLAVCDEREVGHKLRDFSLEEGDAFLPINVKTASTRFERAQKLVGLAPEDCVPIPAYKASQATESAEDCALLYVIAPDYSLVQTLDDLLPALFNDEEKLVWRLLNEHSGTRLKRGEDAFVFRTTRKYWADIREVVAATPFYAVSARKAIRVLQTKPRRTPGIGQKGWGTGASAEVNVHLSLAEDTTRWDEVAVRVEQEGLGGVLGAINRKRVEEVFDPEI